jgi:xanthine/uracil/vitamin C permease (AzgA family)
MIERLFKLSENQTSVRTEVLAGCCISFLCEAKWVNAISHEVLLECDAFSHRFHCWYAIILGVWIIQASSAAGPSDKAGISFARDSLRRR